MATAKASTAQASDAPCDAPVVQVIGQGTLLESGLPFLLVTSGSELGRAHVVAYAYEGVFVGSRCQCDCMAAQFGRACKHVLVAREWLATTTAKAVNDAAAPIVAQLSEIAETVRDLGARETPKTPSARYRQSSQPGDTAMMARSQRPFSLMK